MGTVLGTGGYFTASVDASKTPPPVVANKSISRHCQVLCGAEAPLTENCCSKATSKTIPET